jgi:hypothetical protein
MRCNDLNDAMRYQSNNKALKFGGQLGALPKMSASNEGPKTDAVLPAMANARLNNPQLGEKLGKKLDLNG